MCSWRITIGTARAPARSSWSATRTRGLGAGLAAKSEDESRLYCEDVFRDDLGGHRLLTNKSQWLNFKVVTNQRWSHDNVVLIGDALRTVHFSIGSGTRMALEDAIGLAQAFAAHTDVGAALREFERARRPAVEKFLQVAAHSFIWYEHMREKLPLAPAPLCVRLHDAQWHAEPRAVAGALAEVRRRPPRVRGDRAVRPSEARRRRGRHVLATCLRAGAGGASRPCRARAFHLATPGVQTIVVV